MKSKKAMKRNWRSEGKNEKESIRECRKWRRE